MRVLSGTVHILMNSFIVVYSGYQLFIRSAVGIFRYVPLGQAYLLVMNLLNELSVHIYGSFAELFLSDPQITELLLMKLLRCSTVDILLDVG